MQRKAKNLKFLIFSFGFTLCFLSFKLNGFAQTVSSTELINNAKGYDGKLVVYQGEAIGDVMRRGNFAWINVNDGRNAIGIWVEFAQTKDIIYTGNYKAKGDVVEANGIFHRACPEHGGDLDIHARELRIVEPGAPRPERISATKRNAALLLIGVLGLIWISSLLKRK